MCIYIYIYICLYIIYMQVCEDITNSKLYDKLPV